MKTEMEYSMIELTILESKSQSVLIEILDNMKIVSPLKTAVDKILANQEMSDIVRVIGAGFDSSFDVNKMNFDKIVITSDANLELAV